MLYLVGAAALIYCGWLVLHRPDVKPGQVITASPAHVVQSEPVKVIEPKKVVVYRDRIKVVEKLGMAPPREHEEVQITAEIPRLKYGGQAAVFLNTSTGQGRTEIKAHEAPWFAFRNDLALGMGGGIGTLAGRVRYDVLQIKNLALSGEAEVNYSDHRDRPVEFRPMIWLEYRR